MLRLRKPPPPRVPLVAAGGIQIKDDGQSCATPISLLELIGYSVFQVLRRFQIENKNKLRENLSNDRNNRVKPRFPVEHPELESYLNAQLDMLALLELHSLLML